MKSLMHCSRSNVMLTSIRCARSVWFFLFFFSSRRRHTRFDCDWSSDVCSSDLGRAAGPALAAAAAAPLVLATAAEAFAVATLFLHRAELVERTLHGLHGPIALSPLERLHALVEVSLIVRVALAAEALHLAQELA